MGETVELLELIQEKRQDILAIAGKHGACNVRLFGSAERDEAGPDSDVDFLVDVMPVHSPWFPGGMLVELEQLLGRNVDVVEPEGLHWYIKDKIMSEAVPL